MKRPKQRKPEVKPEPMAFERTPVEKPYDRIANRVLAAVEEINKALDEAHKCAEMRVKDPAFEDAAGQGLAALHNDKE